MSQYYNELVFNPFLAILDVSSSMRLDRNGNSPIATEACIVPELSRLGREHPTMDQTTTAGLILFSTSAEVALPIGASGRLSQLDDEHINLNAEGFTHFGTAFDLARTELEALPQRLRDSGRLHGARLSLRRPLVVMVTDGAANDDVDERNEAWQRLVNSKLSPNIVMVGVGDADPDQLKRYKNRRGVALLSKTPDDVSGALTGLIDLMQGTIIAMGEADNASQPIIDESMIDDDLFEILE